MLVGVNLIQTHLRDERLRQAVVCRPLERRREVRPASELRETQSNPGFLGEFRPEPNAAARERFERRRMVCKTRLDQALANPRSKAESSDVIPIAFRVLILSQEADLSADPRSPSPIIARQWWER